MIVSYRISKAHPDGGLLIGLHIHEWDDETGATIRDEDVWCMRFGVFHVEPPVRQ